MSDRHAPRASSPPRPSRSFDDETVSSPVTACRRCRKQKLRCSRDLPTCKRCKDISAACEYPPPPDRKLLAAQRLQNAKARARRESESSSALQGQHRLSEMGDGRPGIEPLPVDHSTLKRSDSTEESEHGSKSVHEDYQATIPPLQTGLKAINMPSPEVAMFLIEIYFARLYNAHLLFHKETFLADFAANRVPDFVALGIFASASIFLRQARLKSQQSIAGGGDGVQLGLSLLSAADWAKQGNDWAEAGGQRAMMQADIPRFEIVQACQCIGLYWWAVGERERTHITTHNAYMNARLLGLHVQSEDVEDIFEDEVKRRLFWASWMNQCIGQENASFKGEPWKDAVGLKFPSDEESWHARRPNAKQIFDFYGNIVNVDGSKLTPVPSEQGETVKLLCLWWEVQRFLNLPSEDSVHNASSKIAAIHELDHRLGQLFDDLHPRLQYMSPATFTSPKIDKYRLFSNHTLYRATCCALHSSIVPLFANTPTNPYVSKKAVRSAVEESVKHAAVILDMANAFMSSRPDISRLPSMVGFAMFVASTIQFKSLRAQRKLQNFGTTRFKAAIIILDQLKEYWDSLQDLWTNLKSLFASAGINIDAIPTDPRYQLNPDDQNTDLDKIVSLEGTSQSGDTAALYTYVAIQEAKSGASPRRGSDSISHGRSIKSAQNATSPGSAAVHDGQEHALPIHQRQEGLLQSNAQTFAPLQQQPNPQSRTQSFEQQPFPGAGDYRRPSLSAMAPSNFVPLGPVPEDVQTQPPPVGMPYRSVSGTIPAVVQSMDAYGNMPGMMSTEMDVDRMNIWWDQSYGSFDMEVIDPNQNVGGDGYQFQNFSFGSGF